MKNGCILCGGTGSGKTRTSLTYFIEKDKHKELYVITTAKKRDDGDWIKESKIFGKDFNDVTMHVDSWNCIQKYSDVTGAFFIFDEDRVTGDGPWVNAFKKIAKHNRWILLSATPGDTWNDYAQVFIANGFYKNITDFRRQHVIFNRYSKYPKIDKYVNTKKLDRLRDYICVDIDVERDTKKHQEYIYCDYDKAMYKYVFKNRWNPYDDKPCENISELCYILRKVTNSDVSRLVVVKKLIEEHNRVIIFYNFDYELDALRLLRNDIPIKEWNGHQHDPLPTGKRWAYLVQYTAGAEGWNCVTTDTMIFFSQNYSYKIVEQSEGRIDRMNTKYIDLYYYHLKSKAPIDLAISRALDRKQKFNESRYFSRLTSREKHRV